MMKRLHKGFTLVELIVVIAIIGVLASILVPALIGYIKDAKLTTANSSAKTIYTAVNTMAERCLVAGKPLVASASGTSYTFALTDCGANDMPAGAEYDLSAGTGSVGSAEDILKRAVTSTLGTDAENSQVKIVIGSNGFPTAVAWAKTSTDKFVGAYPMPTTDQTSGGISGYTFSSSAYV